MDEIEGLRRQLAREQIIDDELDVGDSFCLQKRTSGTEQALVYVGADELAGGSDPLAEDPKPAHGSAADVEGASSGSVAELREELPAGGLPHARLKLKPLQLRRLVGEQVVLRRHRPEYLRCGLRGARRVVSLASRDGRNLTSAVREGFVGSCSPGMPKPPSRHEAEEEAAMEKQEELASYEQQLADYLQERIKPGLNRGAIPLLARSIAKEIAHRENPNGASEDAEAEDEHSAEAEDEVSAEAEDEESAEVEDEVSAEAEDEESAEA